MFDPAVVGYPKTVMLRAKSEDENLLFIPLQSVLMYDSIAPKPGLSPRHEALALARIGQVVDQVAQDTGTREVFFFCRDNTVADLCAAHGYEETERSQGPPQEDQSRHPITFLTNPSHTYPGDPTPKNEQNYDPTSVDEVRLAMGRRTQTVVVVDDESKSFMYDGPVALAKGDSTAKASEALSLQNQQQQMDFNKSLLDIFQQQFGQQTDVLNYLKGKMQPMIDNPTGYSTDALTSMRTSATDQISNQYESAKQALQRTQFANGSRDLPSGVNDQLNAALLQSEASDKANAQNGITVQDENLKQANYWNAVNSLSGTAAMFNPQSYAGAATNAANSATSAGDSVANLSQAVTASNGPTVGAILGGLAGGAISAAGSSGGFKNLFGGGKK